MCTRQTDGVVEGAQQLVAMPSPAHAGAPTFEDLLSTLPCDVLREGIWLQLSQGSRAAMRCTSKAVRHACEAWMCYGITISLPFDSNLKIKGRRKKKKGRQFLDGMMQKLRLTGGGFIYMLLFVLACLP